MPIPFDPSVSAVLFCLPFDHNFRNSWVLSRNLRLMSGRFRPGPKISSETRDSRGAGGGGG